MEFLMIKLNDNDSSSRAYFNMKEIKEFVVVEKHLTIFFYGDREPIHYDVETWAVID